MKVIAVDFDGTLVDHQYPRIGKAIPYAKEVLWRLYNQGHHLVLWTCRGGESLANVINWLTKHKYPPMSYNCKPPGVYYHPDLGDPKIVYDVLIDDRNLGGLPPWLGIERTLALQHRIFTENTTNTILERS